MNERGGGGCHDFPSQLFFLSTKSFRRGTSLCFRKFMVSKYFMPQTGISEFSGEILLPHSTNKFRKGTLLSSTRSLVSKKFMDKGWGGTGVTTSRHNCFSSQ